jgi:nitroimidazol reductase NimA-like FMN-containing flavoprotein (pyridoxamine 5'-phosphate oxidase superfamily)
MAQRLLEEVPTDECWQLLHQARVGRIVYQDEGGPIAVPVNYAVLGDCIAFRVEGGTKRRAMSQPRLGFEVDHIDDDNRSGWSVIARGTGREVSIDEAAQLVKDMKPAPPVPWVDGLHNVWLLIKPDTITGRRLGDAASPLFF